MNYGLTFISKTLLEFKSSLSRRHRIIITTTSLKINKYKNNMLFKAFISGKSILTPMHQSKEMNKF